VVPVEISLRATFLIFRAGEQLRLEIGGDPAIAPLMGPPDPAGTDASNEGNHVIRSGGGRDSFLQIPTLPVS
jgi:predicted acyl esterase